jgi:hypothetical protein
MLMANPCTSCVRVPVFLVQQGILGLLRICKLQILYMLAVSWFKFFLFAPRAPPESSRRINASLRIDVMGHI